MYLIYRCTLRIQYGEMRGKTHRAELDVWGVIIHYIHYLHVLILLMYVT